MDSVVGFWLSGWSNDSESVQKVKLLGRSNPVQAYVERSVFLAVGAGEAAKFCLADPILDGLLVPV